MTATAVSPSSTTGTASDASPVATIARRAFQDRLKLPVYAGAALGALTVVAVGAFSSINSDDLFKNLPAAFDNLIGGGAGGNYAVTEIFGLMGPIVVLIIAISGGVNAVAGEERDRTAGLLLAQPVPRRDLVVGKACAVAAHLVIALGLFLAGFLAGSFLFDSGIASIHAVAAVVHLFGLAVAFAMVALAVSSWTGSEPISLAVATGLAVVADLGAAMLPLVKGLQGGAKASPWYYYNGSKPLANGFAPTHLLVLAAIALVGFALALVGIERRDVDSGTHGGLAIPALDRFIRPQVGGIFTKSLTERLLMISVVGGSMVSMAIAISLMFSGLESTLADFSDTIPGGISNLYGGANLGTPVGWISAELTSIIVPGVFVAVAVVLGVGAIAGEQQHRTLALLLAAPVSRRRIVVEKAGAMVVVIVAIAGETGLGLLAGSALAGLGLSATNVVAVMAHATLIALFFGGIALALGSAYSASVAVRTSVVAALASYLAQAFLPSLSAVEGFAKVSPWHYYDSSGPLANGFDVVHLAVLAVLSTAVFVAALVLVEGREISD